MIALPLKSLLDVIFLLFVLFACKNSLADTHISPDEIKGSTKVDAESLIKLAIEHKNLVIIDSRIKSDRRQGYIAGSISLPDTETDCFSLFKLINRKNTPTVFYCNGPKCQRSDNAVRIASECGFTNIYWFRGGFEQWKNKNYLISK